VKNAKYQDQLKDGKTTKKAHQLAVQDTVEHLGHSRHRKDLMSLSSPTSLAHAAY